MEKVQSDPMLIFLWKLAFSQESTVVRFVFATKQCCLDPYAYDTLFIRLEPCNFLYTNKF